MYLRRINAALGLITYFWLAEHCIYLGLKMAMVRNGSLPVSKTAFFILFVLIGIHICLSLIIAIQRHNYKKGLAAWKERHPDRAKSDAESARHHHKSHHTPFQRWTGYLLFPFCFLHFLSNQLPFSTRVFGIVQLSFYTLAMLHTAISIPCSLTTLGIVENHRDYRTVAWISGIVCFLVAVLDVHGCFCRYFPTLLPY